MCAGQLVGAQPKLGRSYAELGLLTIGLLAVGIPVLGWESQGPANVPVLLLAPLPLLLWASVRLGPGGLSPPAGICGAYSGFRSN